MSPLLLLALVASATALSCLNQQQAAVDWWIIFKMPTLKDTFPAGDGFYYCDSSNDCAQLQRGSGSITSQRSPFLATVSQYPAQPVQLYWNDQLYNGDVMFDHAHSKGLIAGAANGDAIIINHSLPKFPIFGDNGQLILEYPSNALAYGQHIFCVSTTLADVESIANNYINAEVNVFKSQFNIKVNYPNIQTLAGQRFRETDFLRKLEWSSNSFRSRGGQTFSIFHKKPTQVIDFYSSILSPSLGVGFVAETWGNGQGGLEDPYCSPLVSKSNTLVNVDGSVSYSYTKDHSKYAISLNSGSPYVCFSDFNRQITQHKRGGTSLCFLNRKAWTTMNTILAQRQEC